MGLDLEYIKGQTPIDEEEKEELRKRPITAFASLDGRCRILGKFDPDIYQNYYNHHI